MKSKPPSLPGSRRPASNRADLPRGPNTRSCQCIRIQYTWQSCLAAPYCVQLMQPGNEKTAAEDPSPAAVECGQSLDPRALLSISIPDTGSHPLTACVEQQRPCCAYP